MSSQCAACGKQGSSQELRRCSKCRSVVYCSTECQKSAWKLHKQHCVASTPTTLPAPARPRPRAMSEAVYEGHLETLIKAHIAAVHQEIELAAHLSFCVDGDGHLEGRADQFIFAAHWGIEDVVPGKNVRRQAQLQKCGLMRIEDVVKMLGVDKRTADMGDYDPVVARSTRPYHVKNLRDINNAYLPQPPRVVFGLIIHFYFPTDPRGPSPPIMGDCRTKTVPFYPGRFRWNGPGYIVPPGTMPFFPDWPRWLRSSLTGDGEFERESVEIWFLRYVEAGMFADEVMPLPAGQQENDSTVEGYRRLVKLGRKRMVI